jgi:ADP-dependent NAD(P)H-hydrate dehydratase / NAD(P)H-hydrate epimerase
MNHRVTSVVEAKQLDQLTIKAKDISSYDLMRFASERMVEYIIESQLISKDHTIFIVCGTGNNGGDGLVIYELLKRRGFDVKATIIDQQERFTLEVSQQINHIQSLSMDVHRLNLKTIPSFNEMINQSDIVIDALLGIGVSRQCDLLYCEIIEMINHSSTTVISVDIPSGLNANNGLIMGACVDASHTLVIGTYKYGNLIADARDVSGDMHMIDIGLIMDEAIKNRTYLKQPEHIHAQKRKHHTHKYHYGHVLVVGGSPAMMGSIGLTSLGALRSGAGLVSVATYGDYGKHFRGLPLEVMTLTYQDEKSFEQLLMKKSVVVYGMGVSKNKQHIDVLKQIFEAQIPSVIDADGLTHLSKIDLSDYQDKQLVLTPHMKELSTLLHIPMEQLVLDPLTYVEAFVKSTNLVIVLKGPCTIIVSDKKTVFTHVGNPGLATAGTGDVLSGVIGCMLAQMDDRFYATLVALEIFGAAANLAKDKVGETSMIASDVVEALPDVLK